MIDPDTAQEGAALLATAITEMAEDLLEDAVLLQRGDLSAAAEPIERLRAAATDMTALTEALAVIARRSGGG